MKLADGVFYGSHLLFGAAVARGEAARCGEAAANGGTTAALSGGAAVAVLVVAARVETQKMMRTHEGKMFFFGKKIRFVTSLDLIKCLKHVNQ